MPWIVNVHREAVKQLNAIPPDRRERILNDIDEFVEDPLRGLVKPLKGKAHKGHYRKVSGRYRIIFKPVYAALWNTLVTEAILIGTNHLRVLQLILSPCQSEERSVLST
jgi:mRNA-degrading endonuclease RelE of RelBE toxin-antitoxin system